ncbi:MAG: aminotransferase class V-fold PLP-dependent enzyme [Chitinophagales bacterium]
MPKNKHLPYLNSVVTPLFRTATYYFEDTDDVVNYHEGNTLKKGRYGRYHNPNWEEVEERLAKLDNCESALLFPSGMAAITTTFLAFLKKGDSIIFTENGYRKIRSFCLTILNSLGVNIYPASHKELMDYASFINKHNIERVRIVFVEMPSNPHLHLVDIERIAKVKSPETLLVIDSSFASPMNFKPQIFGADLVLHSCTKYLSGQGDILAGSVAGSQSNIGKIRVLRDMMGSISDANTAFLLNRSLHTLSMRMDHYNKNGFKLARYLQNHPMVKKVYYTGLDDFEFSDLAYKYLAGHGGVVSFELDANEIQTTCFVENLQIPYIGSNFGAVFSLVEQCGIFTYFKLSDQERKKLNISDSFIRYSIGFEPVEIIIEDFEQAFRETFDYEEEIHQINDIEIHR